MRKFDTNMFYFIIVLFIIFILLLLLFLPSVLAVETTNIDGYYKCDDNSASTTIDDAHTSNSDGTMGDSNTEDVSSTTAKIGRSFNFTGNDERNGPDYIDVNDAHIDNSDSSISFWVLTPSSFGSVNQYLLGSSTTFRFFVYVDADGDLFLRIGSSGASAGSRLSTSTWYHIVVTWDQSAQVGKLYLNGDSDINRTSTGTGDADSVNLGSWDSGGDNFWTGHFDEAGFWAEVLSETDVDDLYNSGSGLTYPFSVPDSNCWTETAGKTFVPPTCQYFINVNDFFNPA